MKYYAIEYPNHTTLLVKTTVSVSQVIEILHYSKGIKAKSGAIYNPKSFLTLTEISTPDSRQQLIAQPFAETLIG